MGLFDQLQAYIDANTPRSTRPAVNPAQVIDNGLLGGRIGQIPQRAQEVYQGLLNVPHELASLTGPGSSEDLKRQMDWSANDIMARGVPKSMANPLGLPGDMREPWLNAGMEASGMAPVMGMVGMTKSLGPALSKADDAAGGLLGKVDNSGMTFSDIRPPKENVNRVASSYSNSAKVVGNSTMPLDNLKGGVGREVGDQSRVDKLAQQLSGDGAYLERLIVDDAGNVVEGQHRLEALRKLGVKDVPVVVIKDFARDFPTTDIKGAMEAAQKMPSDNANQLAAHLAEIFADEKGNLAEIAKYEAPRGFEKAWEAALKRLSGR